MIHSGVLSNQGWFRFSVARVSPNDNVVHNSIFVLFFTAEYFVELAFRENILTSLVGSCQYCYTFNKTFPNILLTLEYNSRLIVHTEMHFLSRAKKQNLQVFH